MMRWLKFAAAGLAATALLMVGGTYGASYYYTSQHGAGCASCHEMAAFMNAEHASPHQNVHDCLQCHEASLSTKLRHIRVHLSGNVPGEIRLRDTDVLAMTASCQKCHQAEYASWHAGPHSATYTQIFADPLHNTKRHLMDDCFRCHGMHFSGSIRDLVQPQDTQGPWHITRAAFADQPTMPCLTCHWVHREGAPEARPAARLSVAENPLHDSVAFFDRRERLHFAATSLRIPDLHDGPRAIRISPDPRQGLCYQCHASRVPEEGTPASLNHWGPQAGSGDDRTPIGVHEGLSCFSCHTGHNENAKASCATCHPEMSHCGLKVETMDTTYANPNSRHNIHFVKCIDCHEHGVPKLKKSAAANP